MIESTPASQSLVNRNRATLKLLFVGALSLAMLIPLLMVRAIISERQSLKLSAEHTINQRWGGNQVIGGLVALTRQTGSSENEDESRSRPEWHARVLSTLRIEARMETDFRYLGIYEVPVYTTSLLLTGTLDKPRVTGTEPGSDLVLWLPLSDVRGVREISSLQIGELEIDARPLSISTQNLGLEFRLSPDQQARLFNPAESDDEISYRLELRLAGSQSLQFLPLADTTTVSLDADWPHPEFIGQFLPAERTINTSTTEASWELLGLNRPFGDQWSMHDLAPHQLNQAAFGMRLETPADAYQQSERSVKYGFLFIALTFFTLFLFEVMTGKPLHPVPYVLTGAALAVFYLVLLALSEYLAFGHSFTLAASLLVLIVTPYTGAVLGHHRRGLLVGLMMSLTYALLYVLVSAQHAALLMGSLFLLLAISGLMFLTRKVNWYAYGNNH